MCNNDGVVLLNLLIENVKEFRYAGYLVTLFYQNKRHIEQLQTELNDRFEGKENR
jgi:hypothetical protein